MSAKLKLTLIVFFVLTAVIFSIGFATYLYCWHVDCNYRYELKYFKTALDKKDPDALWYYYSYINYQNEKEFFKNIEGIAQEGHPLALKELAHKDIKYLEKYLERCIFAKSNVPLDFFLKHTKDDLALSLFIIKRNEENFPDSDIGFTKHKQYEKDFLALSPDKQLEVAARFKELNNAYLAKHPDVIVKKEKRDNCIIPEKLPTKGDIIEFGSYPQSADGKMSPLKWKVIDVKGNKALLVTENIIDYRRYFNKTNSFETSYIKEWLNNDFFTLALNQKERERVLNTCIKHENNPNVLITEQDIRAFKEGKNLDTDCKVFLLSYKEAKNGFKNDEDRVASPTEYAMAMGCPKYSNGNFIWALRTPGILSSAFKITGVFSTGSFDHYYFAFNCVGVRPALWLDFSENS